MTLHSQSEGDSFVDHLTELRKRLIRSLIFIGVFSVGAWNFRDIFFSLVRQPIQPYLPSRGLIYTAVQESFIAHLKVSILSGVILSCPFWIYQIWKFVEPGLHKKEKKFGLLVIFFGSVLFIMGVLFVYFIVYPLAFEFLLNFGGGVDQPMIRIHDYLSFFTTTTLVFGFSFELPLVVTLLGMMGLVHQRMLISFRRYALLIICFVSALVTPPDVMSMFLLVGPLYALYELSIVLVGFIYRGEGV